MPALQRERRGACLPPGSHGIEEVRGLIDARASAVREAGHDVEEEKRLHLFESAEVWAHALVVVRRRVVGHDGIRGDEGHHELADAFFKRAQVGIFSVEIRREFRGVDFDVRAEDSFEKVEVSV
ncbi:MAG: hypothetical protein NTV08_05655 [Verrucomicrobia bacterium]|nr:hypothetical protein [Verrucomicrobiota bacterium]